MSEIRCPDSCRYLQTARTHPAVVVRRRDEREKRFFASILDGTTDKQRTIYAMLQTMIDRHARAAVPRLIDRDVADAAAALAATFETASRGIIYEQQPASLPAQRLSGELRRQIEQAFHPSERPVDRDLAVALRRTETMARQAAGQLDAGNASYLEFLARRIGEHEATAAPPREEKSRLIIPG